LPVIFASSLIPFVFFIDSLIMVNLIEKIGGVSNKIATNQYGVLYGVVNSLINMPTIFASAVSLSLLPNLSKEKHKKVKEKARFALMLASLISILFVVIFAVFSSSVIGFLYKGIASYDATRLLQLSSVLVLLMSILSVLTSVFQSAGQFYQNFYVLLGAAVAKYIALLICVLTKNFNIYIACYLNIGFYGMAVLFNLIRFMVHYKVLPNLKNIIFTLLMFLIMYFSAIMFNKYTNFSSFVNLMISSIYLGIIFVVFCYFMFKSFGKGKNQNMVIKKENKNE